uniref:Uncharacterized protein n=1 Tax=Trichuris muris TaxID=70415 RepID=A0A5S6QEJ8_TRIMR
MRKHELRKANGFNLRCQKKFICLIFFIQRCDHPYYQRLPSLRRRWVIGMANRELPTAGHNDLSRRWSDGSVSTSANAVDRIVVARRQIGVV